MLRYLFESSIHVKFKVRLWEFDPELSVTSDVKAIHSDQQKIIAIKLRFEI